MKILYGICGIGNGHLFRQLPILTHFSESGATIVLFAYEVSYAFLQNFAQQFPNVHVVEVAVPYYVGKTSGLDFERAETMEMNQREFFSINCRAMAFAEKILGKPDLVISDYEPVSAQYAYAWDSPFVTIDQQSKFLTGNFPESLEGCFYVDEVMRLRMFFPKATLRIACSFFTVDSNEEVKVVPPILREVVKNLKRSPQKGEILVYLSSQQYRQQPIDDLLELFALFPDIRFHLFTPQEITASGNVRVYTHGDSKFDSLLERCEGIISTAGHSLLSEAMALGIPVLALPLPLYEQQMNGKVIDEHRFGMCRRTLDLDALAEFLDSIDLFSRNIAEDQTVLLRGDILQQILEHLEGKL